MAMVDYGAVVKKNGKIITDPKGGLFQNYSSLKYIEKYIYEVDYYDEDGFAHDVKLIENPDACDETIVTYKQFNWDTNTFEDETKEFSMVANCFALIGDEQFLIGFYKTWFYMAINKVRVQAYNPPIYEWFSEHKKPMIIKVDSVPELSDIVISLVNRNLHTQLFAKFTYKGDYYEVLFGYGVDPDPKLLYGKKSYFYHYKERYCYYKYSVHRFPGRVISKEDRKSLKTVKKWYEAGL